MKTTNIGLKDKSEKRGLFIIVIAIAVLVLTAVILINLPDVWNKENEAGYNYLEHDFWIDNNFLIIETYYDYAEIFIGDYKLEARGGLGNRLNFFLEHDSVPINQVFEIKIVFYEYNEIAETVIIKDIVLTDGMTDKIENPENVKIFFSNNKINIEDLIKFQNIEVLHMDVLEWEGEISLLADLRNIKSLTVLYDIVPHEVIGQLTSLEYLNIWQDSFGEVDTRFLLNLTNLKKLVFHKANNLDVDYSNFIHLKKLEEFAFAINGDDTYKIYELVALPNLKTLDIYIREGTDVDLTPIASLKNLKKLIIFGNDVVGCDVSSLGEMSGLEELYILGFSIFEGNFSFVKEMRDLKILSVSGLGDKKDEKTDLNELTKLRKLEIIRLGCIYNITGDVSVLTSLPNLKSLSLEYCEDIYGYASDFEFMSSIKDVYIYPYTNENGEVSSYTYP